jgi:two-component system nitrogen regulation sensor histidine kinase NtrY
VTFDDITELLSAQRKAAWADIARRIAHEIKNPLTPIQLAAERLRRRYLKEIKQDPETFTICTDTIIRHVGDIGRMIDEFSSFARMPAPVLKPENLAEIVHRAVFLQRTAHREIAFETSFPDGPVAVSCDSRLVGQAVVNIVKNAIEAIEARIAEHGGGAAGQIRVSVIEAAGQAAVIVEDNGKGLPRQGRERLTEPYVTTRRGPVWASPSSRRSWKITAESWCWKMGNRTGRGSSWCSPPRRARRKVRTAPTRSWS